VHVIVVVTAGGANFVRFTNHQHLTVNGLEVPHKDSGSSREPPRRDVTLPRQPPGGAYTFVYTDEQGRQTAAVVPAPPVDFTITEPAAGAQVQIPRLTSQTLTVHYTVPFPPASLPAAPATSQDRVVAQANGNCKEHRRESSCLLIGGGADPVTGAVALGKFAAPYGYGFENLAPGPGSIQLVMTVSWYLPTAEFFSFRAIFQDTAAVPIMRVAS
jgi:hypothetical protein